MRIRTSRARRWALAAGVVVAAGVVPLAVVAATGTFGGALDRQSARWTTSSATTSSTDWRNVPGLTVSGCTKNQVTAMLSAVVRGAPVQFRVIADGVPEAPFRPRAARFVPDGTEGFSFAFVGNTAAFEADDSHRFNVQWRSPSGAPVTLQSGVLNVLYQRGTQGC